MHDNNNNGKALLLGLSSTSKHGSEGDEGSLAEEQSKSENLICHKKDNVEAHGAVSSNDASGVSQQREANHGGPFRFLI